MRLMLSTPCNPCLDSSWSCTVSPMFSLEERSSTSQLLYRLPWDLSAQCTPKAWSYGAVGKKRCLLLRAYALEAISRIKTTAWKHKKRSTQMRYHEMRKSPGWNGRWSEQLSLLSLSPFRSSNGVSKKFCHIYLGHVWDRVVCQSSCSLFGEWLWINQAQLQSWLWLHFL